MVTMAQRAGRRGPPPPSGSASGPTLAYAIVPRNVPFVNKGRFWSGDRLARRAPRLWITADRIRGGVALWFCDGRWRARNVVTAPSLKGAKKLAESFYPGLAGHWIDLRVSKAAAARYLEKMREEEGCSVCRRVPAEAVEPWIKTGDVRLCKSCIVKLHAAVAGQP
jgi:hypothetical protein